MANEALAIEAKEVTKTFGGRHAPLVAVDAASLVVEPGGFVCLLGPSGCGKSTLLQMIAGLVPVSAGSIAVNGKEVTGPPDDLVYVFQQYTKSVFPWRTVLGNVLFGLRARGQHHRGSDQLERARAWIELMGLTGFEEHYPRQLSGGMQQRVALARALACGARILLMDEPFSSVDALTRATLQDALLDVWGEGGLTVVFVTHDVDEAVYLGQRVVVMTPSPGRIRATRPVDLSYPRDQLTTREHDGFLKIRHDLYGTIMDSEETERAG